MLGKALLDHTKERKEILLQMDEPQDQMWEMNDRINLIERVTTVFEFVEKTSKVEEKPSISSQ